MLEFHFLYFSQWFSFLNRGILYCKIIAMVLEWLRNTGFATVRMVQSLVWVERLSLGVGAYSTDFW